MLINDLMMNQDCVYRDIQCKMAIKQKIISKNGRVEMMGDNLFKFITKDNVIDFSIAEKNNTKIIMDYFNRHFFCLANVTVYFDQGERNNIFFLHMGFFYNMQRWGRIPVIISNDIKDEISKNHRSSRKSLEQILEDNFKLSDGVSSYFAYTVGKDYINDENLEEKIDEGHNDNIESSNTDKIDLDKAKEAIKNNSLIVFGKDFCFYASITGEKLDSKLIVEKIVKKKNNIPMMRLSEGTLEFFDHNAIMSKKVKEVLDSTKGYLDLWNQYAEEEGKQLLEKARKVGLITLHREKATFDSAGIHVPYSNISKSAEELIKGDSYLFFSAEIPVYLSDPEMTWNDYRTLQKEAREKKYSINRGMQVRVSGKKNGGLLLAPEDGILPDANYVSLSILGDESQIIRKEEARHRIMMGEAANPALGLIFEGQLTEALGNYSNRKKIMPLSAFVKDKVFKGHDPTETQKKAIDIALNTPDIAIIQGPPGTGKTTVITAIIERLNEICDKRENVNGQVLITSFQHDAVRNVIGRLKINSLPTIKFGKQEHGGDDDLTKEKIIEDWCEDYINRLNARNPELVETEQRKQLSTLHNIYLAYPSDQNALTFLKCAKELNCDVEIDKQISRLIEVHNINDSEKISLMLTLIRRLRTSKAGFVDDGADNADSLLQYLEDMGINQSILSNKKVFDILDEAALCYGKEPDEQLLTSLKEVKRYLLDKCIPKPSYKKDIPDEEITVIYKILNQSVKKHDDEKSAILADLLKEIRSNRSEVERALEHYLFVYSATTQQSEGREIKDAKGIARYADEHPEYETVIVDEAARVSPADLMIPLAQAKKRIILVGDHRQLPHIYDEEIFESMKENGEAVDINNIKKSMFEYLLEKAKELEKIDNIPRTIVLDAQYRMHPMLGEFVDEVFYKPHYEHFSSPLPAKNYTQYISKKSLPIEWYHFSEKYGSERKVGTSRVRECEADFIVAKLQECLYSEKSKDENGEDLTYGVISFYSEQVKYIKRKLKKILGDDSEKVRVGSVDAFQGMEFDVIFLSIVRSNDSAPKVRIERGEKPQKIDFTKLEMDVNQLDKDGATYKEWESYRDKAGLQNYGFLISENRLCVSLSRQKRLLVVVGNTDMFKTGDWGRLASVCVPGMKNLYELCKREGVIYDGQSEGI